MLLLGCIVGIFAGQGHRAAVGNLAAPVGLVIYAVHVDGAAVVREVEAAILGVELGHRAGELEIGVFVGRSDELGHGAGLCVVVVRGRFRPALGDAVQAVEITAVLDAFRGVAAVIHELCVNDYLVPHFDLGVAFLPLPVAQVKDTVGDEAGVGAFVHHGELGVAVLGAELFLDFGDLALHIVRTHLFVIVVSRPGEVLHGIESGGHIERIFLGAAAFHLAGGLIAAAVGLAVEAVEITAGGFRGVAAIVHQLCIDDDLVAGLDLVLPLFPLLVAQIQDAVGDEFRIEAFVHQVEGAVAVLGAELLGDGADLALHVERTHLVELGGRSPGEVFHRVDGGRHVERIVLGAAALGLCGGAAAAGVAALVHAVQAEQECSALLGLGRIALVIDHVAVEDDIVPYLHLGISLFPLLVAQIQDTIGGELVCRGGPVVGDGEGAVAELGAESLRDGGDLTLDVHLLGAVHICPQLIQVGDDSGYGIRLFLGAVSQFHGPLGALLVDGHAGFGQADGENDITGAVVAAVGQYGNGYVYGFGAGLSLEVVHADPVRTGDHPVPGGGEGYGLGAAVRSERKLRRGYRNLGRAKLFLLLAGDKGKRTGQEGQQYRFDFHKKYCLVLLFSHLQI